MSTEPQFDLRLGARTLRLAAGARLGAPEIAGLGMATPDGSFAEVAANPADPAVLGLKNLGDRSWSARTPRGDQRAVDAGRSVRLENETVVDFGPITGTIRQAGKGFALDFGASVSVPLTVGSKVTAYHVLGMTAAATSPAAEIVRNPDDPTVLGLKNLTGAAWTAWTPDGGQRRLEPGRSVRLAAGTSIQIGAVKAEIAAPSLRPAADTVRTQPSPTTPADAGPVPPRLAPAFSGHEQSIWWIIVPTLAYAALSFDWINTLVLAAIGVALRLAQARPEIPANVRGFLPLVQSLAAFVFLGGNPLVITAVAAAGGVAAFMQGRAILTALEPWWRMQRQIPAVARRPIAFVLALAVGYWFGTQASVGDEWTYTFLSIVLATVITFLLVFTPPAGMQRST